MNNQHNSLNLIHLLASYRRVEFPQQPPLARGLAGITANIENNCAITIRFVEARLRGMEDDGEELFCLCSLRAEAQALCASCRLLRNSGRGGRTHALNHLVTLRSQYDTFVCSVRYFFFLLDRDLAGRVHGAL
jgi:hypothetical protein